MQPIHRVHVRHVTRYQYDQPVERSEHWLHLRPVDDYRQRVLESTIHVSPEVEQVEYEDVFGNRAVRFVAYGPYNELNIEATSLVDVIGIDPFEFQRKPINRSSFPIAWMPWETAMLAPYLRAEELPPTQLRELYEYAMSFVRPNNGDVMETLFAINLELFRSYKYIRGTTTVATSAFDVLCNKRGVCQDFANLFICMARLLGIPARYVCGYLFTGNNGATRSGSDASHAWVQLYIPDIGWKGFDPTNGILPHLNHIRVAVGRHYRDTSPTSGTLFGDVTPASETMTVDVEVTEVPLLSQQPAVG
jgi:transglutaminase-like putative cysteine protease